MPELFPPPEAEARAAQLRAEIARHNVAYYVNDAPEIPDVEYDKWRIGVRSFIITSLKLNSCPWHAP